MKSFLEFITEKLGTDTILDLYQQFIRILKLHEEHYYHKVLISNDKEFKEELNLIFKEIQEETVKNDQDWENLREELYKLILIFEKRLHKKRKFYSEYLSSLYDVCSVVTNTSEDLLERLKFLENFQEDSIYKQNKEEYEKSLKEVDSKIEDLKSKERGTDEFQELLRDIWRESIEEGGDDVDAVISGVVSRLISAGGKYPHLREEIQEEIEYIIDSTSNEDELR